MASLGRSPGAAPLTSADIPDGSITAAKIVDAYDDKIQTNLAILAFRTATNASGIKFNLQDQVIDEYGNDTGIDDGPSDNHVLTAGVYSGGGATATGGNSTDTSVTNYTTRVFTSSGALTVTGSLNASVLVVGGGGSGGTSKGGGGGAGGLVYDAVYALTANTYDMVIGNGGTGVTASGTLGNNGVDSTVTINGGAMQFTAKGGGGGGQEGSAGNAGGSGGGASYSGAGGTTTQNGTTQGVTPDVNIGYVGGTGTGSPNYNPAGGGGAGGAGGNAVDANAGIGGVGYNAGAIFGTALGDGGYFASGGGGGWTTQAAGSASAGGGTAGGTPSAGNSAAATDGTGGGSGGGAGDASGDSGDGGSGVVLVRYLTTDAPGVQNLTLQSIDTEAEAQPTKADMVMLMEDTAGTATVNTDIKGFISRDSGASFTEGDLIDEGDWDGTSKRILAFHDLDISGQPADKTMCYKITTHNQSVSKETKIHATSIGWR